MPSTDIRDTRRTRLHELLSEHDGVPAELARTLRKPATQVSHWLHGQKNISETSAREIEKRARKPPGWLDAEIHQRLVAEPSSTYDVEPDWPLQTVTAHQLRRLQPQDLGLVEGHIKLVLSMAEAADARDRHWRRVALEMAAHADGATGGDAFTQFCIAVDQQAEKEHARASRKVARPSKQQ